METLVQLPVFLLRPERKGGSFKALLWLIDSVKKYLKQQSLKEARFKAPNMPGSAMLVSTRDTFNKV